MKIVSKQLANFSIAETYEAMKQVFGGKGGGANMHKHCLYTCVCSLTASLYLMFNLGYNHIYSAVLEHSRVECW